MVTRIKSNQGRHKLNKNKPAETKTTIWPASIDRAFFPVDFDLVLTFFGSAKAATIPTGVLEILTEGPSKVLKRRSNSTIDCSSTHSPSLVCFTNIFSLILPFDYNSSSFFNVNGPIFLPFF